MEPEPPRGRIGLRGGIVAAASLLAALVALPALILEPASTDLAAQTFRADLWSEHGWVLYSDAWYSGHLIPGYSLLYPPLGAWLGPELVGWLSAIAAAAAFAALVRRLMPGARGAVLAAIWFALGAGALIYTGRITFMLGLPFGLLAVLAAARRPPAIERRPFAARRLLLAAALAALAALASPVIGLFTALAGAAILLGGRVREGLALAAGAGVATPALALAFPVGGSQPFPFSSFWWVVLACALVVGLVPPWMRTLRIGIAIYVVLLIALYVVSTPIGTNAPRLGALLLGPLAALALLDRRPRLLALAALPLLYWQLAAPIGDLIRGAGDPSTKGAFYTPLLDQLDRRTGERPVRVEVPPTRERWESVYVAERYPLARGWLRQLETADLDSFLDGNLTAGAYREWLIEHGVSYVALPNAILDYISTDERDLLEGGRLPFLREVFADADWTLWEVLPADGGPFVPGAALAGGGGARITALGPDGFSVAVPGPGRYLLRMRYSSYLEASGDACLEDAGEASSLLVVPGPEPGGTGSRDARTITVDARMSIDGLLGVNRLCSE